MKNRFRLTRLAAGALFVTIVTTATGGASAGQASGSSGSLAQFPSSPAAWINSSPLSTEMLEGKGVILYFFDDG